MESLESRDVPAVNPIIAENQLAGTPQSTWGVSGSGDSTLQGFATDISVNHGQTVSFKIDDSANKAYHIDIYRLGYYQGNGARLVTTIPNTQVLKQVQPNPITNTATGLVDAGNWAVSASWAVPSTAVSGLYIARLVREDTGGASLIWFVVRDDEGGSDMLFQTADTTWQAYNAWGGYSLYQHTGAAATDTANSLTDAGRAVKVSYNRPLVLDGISGGYGDYNSPLHAEYPMIRWLEANGYNVSYSTDVDSDRRGAELLEHKVYMSVGHDEYWSGGQRANVEAARDAGVNLAFFSGNESYWKVRWENSVDGSGTSYRTLVCYKESKDNARTDPLDISQNVWTGTWRDARFSPPADGGRPENAMTGTMYMVDRTSTDLGISMTVNDQDGKLRFWRNTTVATLGAGQTATLGQFIVGYETDEDVDNGFRPAGLMTMSATTFNTSNRVTAPWGTEYGAGTSTHKITLYRASSGALVFGAGTIQWSWGLDGTHNNQATTASVPMQQATVNLFADMGVQPGSLKSGLVAASASTDTVAPTSTITSPSGGATVQVGAAVTITGTAADTGGGIVAGVEVSTDGGLTWHPATGRASWSYTWIPAYGGSAVIKTRAVDDSGNIGAASAGTTITVSSSNTLVAAYSFDAGTGTTLADLSGKGNNGTIANATWTAGKFGNALTFNGTNSMVTIADSASLRLTGAMTLEAWVKPTTINSWETVVLKEASGDLTYALYADNNGDDIVNGPRRPVLSIRQGSVTYGATGSAQLTLNQWTHIAATYDGTAMKFYVNGTLASTVARTGAVNSSTNPLRIGGNTIWGEYFNGLIDEVRIYSRALADTEIQADMVTSVSNPDTQSPTTPTNVSATGSVGAVALGWSASTDNVAVDHYNVYRSTTSGFTPGTTNLIGQPTGTSYSDSGITPGTYYYRVIAVDAAGNLSSAAAEVSGTATADTTAPTVSISTPLNNATVGGTVTITASASDNVGVAGVLFYLDGNVIGSEDVTPPFSIAWNSKTTTNGTHTLTAIARDAAGNTTTSSEITITVDNDLTAPTVSITAPSGGTTVTGSVTVSATASDNIGVAGVQFYLDGNLLSTEDTTNPYSITWNSTGASNGTHSLTAVARDAAGNTTTSTAVSVTVSNTVATGLVGAWGFEEGSGTTTADASGHSLTGTLTNATWSTAGKYGKALSFNGTNALVTVAHNALLALTNGMTIEAWVKPTAASSDWAAAVLKERGTTGLAYGLYASDGANSPPAGYINRSGADISTRGTSTLALNTWTHLAVTYDGANLRLYINGTQVASKAQTGNINSSTAPLRFGGNNVWGEYFTGLLDEIRIYSVALSATQIQSDMNSAIGTPQLAAEGTVPGGSVPVLTPSELAPIAAEAVRRWQAAGLNPTQLAALASTQFEVRDLGPTGLLGLTPLNGTLVLLDDDGAGRGWFVDPTPAGDSEFAQRVAAGELQALGGPAVGQYDLLTVAMHELGHVLGLDDVDPASVPHDLLTATLSTGVRRLPGSPPAVEAPVIPPVEMPAAPAPVAPVADAAPSLLAAPLWLGPTGTPAPVSLPGMPVGESVAMLAEPLIPATGEPRPWAVAAVAPEVVELGTPLVRRADPWELFDGIRVD